MDLEELWKPSVTGELWKPVVTEELAVSLIRDTYGLDVVEIKKMPSFNDQNFLVQVSAKHSNSYIKDEENKLYTLKIINIIKSSLLGHFGSMHAAMMHLTGKGLQAPIVVKNLEGETWKLVNVPLLNEEEGQVTGTCGVHLLTYLQGIPLAHITKTPDILFQWGSLLAKTHIALEDLHCEELLHKPILFSLENLLSVRQYMGKEDASQKALILKVLNEFEVKLPSIRILPKGFLHGDFGGNNVLALQQSPSAHYIVNGILDFEDMHYGPYIADVGLVLADVLIDHNQKDVFTAGGHVLAGYLSQRQLSQSELSILKFCIECRLAQSLVLCLYSRRADPGNAYVSAVSSIDAKQGLLERLSSITNEEFINKLAEQNNTVQCTVQDFHKI